MDEVMGNSAPDVQAGWLRKEDPAPFFVFFIFWDASQTNNF